ncbi:MAG: class I SAM-dependent methyltransferase [Acutalibacteraceae bacterium]
MTQRPLFKLDNRLALCAELVRNNARIADIGTDHAYLPIWLARTGRISHAIAADLRPEPLHSGKENIAKYHVENMIETRLSDGLTAINSDEVDDIIIAGMGGELIAKIIDAAPWIKENEKHLILQPMTKSEHLREYLYKNGFEIIKEKAVIADNKVYSVMCCAYSGNSEVFDNVSIYIGKLNEDNSDAAHEYILGKIKMLELKANGLTVSGHDEEAEKLRSIISEIRQLPQIAQK